MPEVTKTLRVENKAGFHLRVASMISKAACAAKSEVTLANGSYRADCKSCLDLLALMAPRGTILTLVTSGEDAESVAEAIESMFRTKFGEDEYAVDSGPNASSASSAKGL